MSDKEVKRSEIIKEWFDTNGTKWVVVPKGDGRRAVSDPIIIEDCSLWSDKQEPWINGVAKTSREETIGTGRFYPYPVDGIVMNEETKKDKMNEEITDFFNRAKTVQTEKQKKQKKTSKKKTNIY